MNWISIKDRFPDPDVLIAFKAVYGGDEYYCFGLYRPPTWFFYTKDMAMHKYFEGCISHWRISLIEEFEEPYKLGYWHTDDYTKH